MKAVERRVFWAEPCSKFVVMPATLTPSPTWAGLVPPACAVGAEPLRMTWDSVSSKTVWLLLKPTVLTLAMLLPVTSSLVWWARRPAIAEFIERSMGRGSSGTGRLFPGKSPGEGREGDGGSGGAGLRDLGEPAERDVDAVDDGAGLVAGDLHR